MSLFGAQSVPAETRPSRPQTTTSVWGQPTGISTSASGATSTLPNRGSAFGQANGTPTNASGATSTPANRGVTTAPVQGGLFGSSTLGPKPVHDPRTLVARNFDARDTIVEVSVGEPATIFHIHRSVLLRSSDFLQTKAKPEWSKGEATVNLPGHPSVAFNIYSKWLYSGSILSRTSFGLFGSAPKEDSEWACLAHAFALGEELMDTEFKDTIMDALRAKAQSYNGESIWPVAANVVRIIYDGTPAQSPARKFIVDIYHSHADATALDSTDGFPAEFLLDLSRISLSRRIKTKMTEPGACSTTSCVYHEHGKEGKCYVNRKL
ncbi:hypothetical protein PRZ48_011672 [Zasmidium cellare]|uniref:BTB domain-containing protein n=1 Tax=Zasmidium cellare TaxID=395010 RepID=A0ABR0E704_ZASCE|nr:hypothetical protein PRZ48_011672 [Zasmidium cellare]